MERPEAAGTPLLPPGSPSDPSPAAPGPKGHTKRQIVTGSPGQSRSLSVAPRGERVPPGTTVGAGSGAACSKWGPLLLLLFFP